MPLPILALFLFKKAGDDPEGASVRNFYTCI